MSTKTLKILNTQFAREINPRGEEPHIVATIEWEKWWSAETKLTIFTIDPRLDPVHFCGDRLPEEAEFECNEETLTAELRP